MALSTLTRSVTVTGLTVAALALGVGLPSAAVPAPADGPRAVNARSVGDPTAAGTPTSSTAETAPTAASQVNWLLTASRRLPIPAAEVEAHLAGPLLQAAGGATGFNRGLAAVAGTRGLTRQVLVESIPTSAKVVVAGTARYLLELAVGPDGRIGGLEFQLWRGAPRSWAALDRRLAAVAPDVSFLAARVDTDGTCVPIHAVAPNRPRPLGSAFKLYVLAALAHEIATGHASWSQQLAIRNDWKSLPSGILQKLPAGTGLTLEQYAAEMISISDNTAADHLIHHLGKRAVEAQLARSGMAEPSRDIPFLTTRELFQLKGSRHAAALRRTALAVGPSARRHFLNSVVDRLPLRGITAWTKPVAVDELEWFASAADMCRVYSGLAAQSASPAMAPLSTALSINDGGVGLSHAGWPTVWFKGGSEPGVITITYLARTAGGQTYVVSALASNPGRAIPGAGAAEMVALARGGLQLSRAG